MQSWGGITLLNTSTEVSPANTTPTGPLTQLYPGFLQSGSAIPGFNDTRRRPTDGCLHRFEINPQGAIGGTLELWDISGEQAGASDVNSLTSITPAYLATQVANKKAKLLWTITFDGDDSATNKILGTKLFFAYGLAARWSNPIEVAGSASVTINAIVDGGYRLWEGELNV
jgi:hypothetical protein